MVMDIARVRAEAERGYMDYWQAHSEFLRTLRKFLKADIETAMTFIQVAQASPKKEIRRRNQHNAKRAYDTVLRYLSRIEPEQRAQWEEVIIGLKKLKSELKKLGETC